MSADFCRLRFRPSFYPVLPQIRTPNQMKRQKEKDPVYEESSSSGSEDEIEESSSDSDTPEYDINGSSVKLMETKNKIATKNLNLKSNDTQNASLIKKKRKKEIDPSEHDSNSKKQKGVIKFKSKFVEEMKSTTKANKSRKIDDSSEESDLDNEESDNESMSDVESNSDRSGNLNVKSSKQESSFGFFRQGKVEGSNISEQSSESSDSEDNSVDQKLHTSSKINSRPVKRSVLSHKDKTVDMIEEQDSSNESGEDSSDQEGNEIKSKPVTSTSLTRELPDSRVLKEEQSSDSGDDDEDFNDDGQEDSVDMDEDNPAADEQDEYSKIRKELADIPFEDLLKIKEKVGVKAFNKILHGKAEDKPRQKDFKRTSKHKEHVLREIKDFVAHYRPREMSSKKPVSVLKNRTAVNKKWVARDPRFDDLSGDFKEYHFTKNYSFLEDMKEKEREVVKKKLKKTSNDKKKKELKGLLNRLQQEQQVKEMKKKKQDLEKMYVEKEREMVKEGKTPYFLKKSDKKTLELAMKFKELKQTGRLDSYMSKKRRKVAQKQRKKMPSQQSGVI